MIWRDQVLQIVSVGREVGSKPVEQIFIPGLGVHIVGRFHDAASKEFSPIAIHDGTRKASIFRMNEPIRSSFPARFQGVAEVDLDVRQTETSAAAIVPRRTSHRTSSKGFSENMLARPYVSRNFQRLIKLSWQAAHFMLIPRKTCAAFCAACIGGV